MIYYVDSKFGKPEYDGTSRQFPLKTLEQVNALKLNGGDSVLFKCGDEFVGCLHPQRADGEGMVTLGSYGIGEKPIIMGDSAYAVFLENISGVEVNGLGVQNPNGRCGIRIENNAGGAMEHVHIRYCHISHVNDTRDTYNRFEGGISCTSNSEEEVGPGWFNDLLLEYNELTDVCRTGIVLGGDWANRWRDEEEGGWGHNKWINDNEGWWPSYGVVIRGNYLDRVGGDGIFIIGTVDALIEWNKVFHMDTRVGLKEANAGIWCQSSNNCVIQYNESAYAYQPYGCGDCFGFDIDYTCRDTIVQYNYSHDNGGGFITQTSLDSNVDHEFGGSIIRYNLSVNDGHIHGDVFCLWGPQSRVLIENNTVAAGSNARSFVGAYHITDDITFRHNIFMNNGRENIYDLDKCTNVKMEGNLYCGRHTEIHKLDEQGMSFEPQFKIAFDERQSRDGLDTFFDYIPRNKDLYLKTEKEGEEAQYIGAMKPML